MSVQAIPFGPPFDDEDADVIIRSSDEVEFRVFKFLLGRASPVFQGMFSLPSDDTVGTVPTVDVSENVDVVAKLLRLCYPAMDPPLTSLDEVRALFTACQKYEMETPATRLVGIAARTFVESDPFNVYVLSCRARATEEARRAAFHCLSMTLSDIIHKNVPDSQDVSMVAYSNLLRYHDACREASVAVLSERFQDYRSLPWLEVQVWENYCWAHSCGLAKSYGPVILANGIRSRLAPWFGDLMGSLIAHLKHDAAPMSPRLFGFIDSPKDKMCDACKSGYAISLSRFFSLLEEELKRRVKAVSTCTCRLYTVEVLTRYL